jgi:ATP-dependent helicase HrpB
MPLPIWQIHQEILAQLMTGNRLVLIAPTGSGKTTQAPQMLLDAGMAGPAGSPSGNSSVKKIVVLQPRRVAARTVAARVAWERKSNVGQEVGYQIRLDDRTGLGTRICYVTEGILLRWLQDNPTLDDVGIVLLDEFHERNLLSDVALALIKELQQTRRPDLKLLVMSATLDAEPVATYLSCPILRSEGQAYPVEVRYLEHKDERPVADQAADAVEQIVQSGAEGDILVFMPGLGEIQSTLNALRAARIQEKLALIPLHGELPPEEQDLAFAPNSRRKVVVATNVAETSVTIDGIRHVVDSGLARVARFDAERGVGTLFLEPISRASSDQRKGRAGRTAPGVCHRLWTESGHLNRPEANTPEIQRSDLAETVLLLHSLGIRSAIRFDWLDAPEPQAVKRAEELLRTLGALHPAKETAAKETEFKETGEMPKPDSTTADAPREPVRGSDLTPIGRRMLRLPMHPRYSRMLVEASRYGCVRSAALCAALVSGRDLLIRLGRDDKHIAEARELFEASAESDFFTLIRAFRFAQKNQFNFDVCRRYGIHAQIARQVDQTFDQIAQIAQREGLLEKEAAEAADSTLSPAPENPKKRTAKAPDHTVSDDPLLRCIMTGFIDQLCIRRDQGTLNCELTEGRMGTLMRESVVQTSPLFVTASIKEVASRGSEKLTLLGLASAVKREWIQEMFPEQITAAVEHLYDRTHKRVAAIFLERFHDLVIHHEHASQVEPLAAGRALAQAARKGWFELPLFNHEIKQFVARVNLIACQMPDLGLKCFNDEAMTETLALAFSGLTLAKEAQAAPLKEAFLIRIGRGHASWVDELTPSSIIWPDARKMKLLYAEPAKDDKGKPQPPELQIKLNECFCLKEHPAICEGKLPVKLWLCAPDGKRLEATLDWPSFKTNRYPAIKSALRLKYPGMAWL